MYVSSYLYRMIKYILVLGREYPVCMLPQKNHRDQAAIIHATFLFLYVNILAHQNSFAGMEWSELPIDPRDASAPAWRVRIWPTSGYRRRLLLACGTLYFIVALIGAVNWSFFRHPAEEAARYHPGYQFETKNLAVVVPMHAGDVEEAVEALSSWPNVCSRVTLDRVQLVLYYSGGTEDGGWADGILDRVERTGGRCFERTKVVFADLDDKVTTRVPRPLLVGSVREDI